MFVDYNSDRVARSKGKSMNVGWLRRGVGWSRCGDGSIRNIRFGQFRSLVCLVRLVLQFVECKLVVDFVRRDLFLKRVI